MFIQPLIRQLPFSRNIQPFAWQLSHRYGHTDLKDVQVMRVIEVRSLNPKLTR